MGQEEASGSRAVPSFNACDGVSWSDVVTPCIRDEPFWNYRPGFLNLGVHLTPILAKQKRTTGLFCELPKKKGRFRNMSYNETVIAAAVDKTIDYLKDTSFRTEFRQSPDAALAAIGIDPDHMPASFMEMLMTLSDEEIAILGNIRRKLSDRDMFFVLES